MSKFLVLLLCMNILCISSFGQSKYELKGTVVDENKQPLPGATVYLFPISKGSITDKLGNFVITGINTGMYKIEISFMGYNSTIDTLKIDRDIVFNAQLSVSALTLQEVVVSDNYTETRKKEQSLNIEIVNDDYLKQNLGGSLMQSLERLPGVTTIDIEIGRAHV